MKIRFIIGLIIIALVALPLLTGGVLLAILMAIIGCISMYEIIVVSFKKLDVLLLVLSLSYIGIISISNRLNDMTYTIIFIVILFLLAIINSNYNIVDLTLIFIIALIVGVSANTINNIYLIDNRLMFLIVISNYCTDIGAYLFGYKFGKRPLNKRVSKNKTIEGCIGGWITSFIISIVFSIIFIIPYLTIDYNLIIVICIIIPIIAQLGDLTFSLIKRYYNIKDFGQLFLSHGGMLDRLDSLYFSLLFIYSILNYINI